jgi:PLP dependent protein
VASHLTKNLAAVQTRIEQAAQRAGRNADEIKLVAVSKTHPASILADAIAAGIKTLGENKVQEGQEKIPVVGRDKAEWHLIGHLQSNKARKAVQLFDVIESLDSLELAERLERICLEEGRVTLPVFIQVDLANEETKSGIAENELPGLVGFLQDCKILKLDGLMTVPPYFDETEKVRPYFQRLRSIRDKLLPNGGLSMGMSHDFEIAIEEGATIVRIGSAIFGQREVGLG